MQKRSIGLADVLSALAPREAEAFTAAIRAREYPRGTFVYAAGDEQKGLYLAKQGLIEEFRLTENGEKLPMNRVLPGRVFGLSTEEGRYCCFAEAVEDSTVGFLSFQALEDLCRWQPKASVKLVEVLARRLGQLEDRLEHLAFGGLRGRVAWALLGLSATHGPRLRGVTHEALAAWAAGSRPKVSIVLKDMEKEGLVLLSRGQIEICNEAALEEWAESLANQ